MITRRGKKSALIFIFLCYILSFIMLSGCQNNKTPLDTSFPQIVEGTKTTQILDKANKDNPRNSESSAIELSNETILVAYVHFFGINDYDKSQIFLTKSSDDGENFSVPEKINITNVDLSKNNVMCPSFILLDDKRLVLFIVEFLESRPNELPISNLYMCTSDDNGNSFVAKKVWNEKPYCISNDNVKILESGRILLPVIKYLGEYATANDTMGVFTIYSDNDGESFIVDEKHMMNLPMRGMMEPYVVEYKQQNKVALVCRTQLGSPFVAYSYDSGIMFTKPQTMYLSAPESTVYVKNWINDNALIIWHKDEYDMSIGHYGKRSILTLGVTKDCKNVKEILQLENDKDYYFFNPSAFYTSKKTLLVMYARTVRDKESENFKFSDLILTRIKISESK